MQGVGHADLWSGRPTMEPNTAVLNDLKWVVARGRRGPQTASAWMPHRAAH